MTQGTIIRRGVESLVIGLALNLVSHAAQADVVAVVSAKRAITTLTKTQLTDIFLGKVSRFPNGTQANPIDQVEEAPARQEFYAKLAGLSAPQLKAYWSRIIFTGRGQPPPEVRNSAEMKKRIAANLAAIGYMEEDLVDDTIRIVR